jgi:hypothetical protein
MSGRYVFRARDTPEDAAIDHRLPGIPHWIELTFIRDQFALLDATFSKRISTLDAAGVVTLEDIAGQGVEAPGASADARRPS